MATFQDNSAKDREHATWTEVAPGWQKHDAILRAMCAVVTERLLGTAAIGVGQRVLDLASGTGEPAIPAAEQVGPSGRVLGIDFVEEMLAIARHKAQQKGLRQLEFRCADAETLELPSASFDAALIRFGIMFMPDVGSCLLRVRKALRAGGRLSVAVWGRPEQNPWVAVPLTAIRRQIDVPAPPPGAPGLFAFANPEHLRSTLQQAGFEHIQIEEVPIEVRGLADGAEFFTFISELAGPIARLLARLTPSQHQLVAAEVAREIETQRTFGEICVPGLALVAHCAAPR